ncbi:MAG: beta-glucanase precursor [Planctomycetes bacterium]|nr:beta-glucanase precursor [Planctomycetota bacterium]
MSVLLSFMLVLSLEATDFGDHSSSTLTTKAWENFAAEEYDDALACINKCEELYGAKAKTMNAGLKDYAAKDTASKLWALNDVGTCMFVKGELYAKKGDKAKAVAAYKKLIKDYQYAQCWDTKGWFWQPAKAAKQKVIELEFDM